eukprot:139922-Karenia_brevis.AAC.1
MNQCSDIFRDVDWAKEIFSTAAFSNQMKTDLVELGVRLGAFYGASYSRRIMRIVTTFQPMNVF